jgi:hypothetical protein
MTAKKLTVANTLAKFTMPNGDKIDVTVKTVKTPSGTTAQSVKPARLADKGTK